MNEIKWAFFGTPWQAQTVLDELKGLNLHPSLVICAPDKPVGRKHTLTAPPTKEWAIGNRVPIKQYAKLDNEAYENLSSQEWDVFLVAAYGLFLPKRILEIPRHHTLNIHPSLLPKYRGAAPVAEQILQDDSDCGVTLMQIDEEMDHGPVIAQASYTSPTWPILKPVLEESLFRSGAQLFANNLEDWVAGTIIPKEQNHNLATFSRKLTKEDGLINFNSDSYQNYLKYCALNPWPGTYFFIAKDGRDFRVKINEATYSESVFQPLTVTPEGRGQISWNEFTRWVGFDPLRTS